MSGSFTHYTKLRGNDNEAITDSNPLPVLVAGSVLPTGAATSSLQTSGNSLLTDIKANQTNQTQVVTHPTVGYHKISSIYNAGSPQICSQPYLQALAEGDIAGHIPWTKIGYCPIPNTTERDIWSYGATVATIPLMSTADTLKVQSNNDADAGTVIKGDATGDTVTSDAGGTTTTLVDADVDFTAATAVAAGDCIILDPHGTSPEWGYVTAVDTHTLTVGLGFSSGGSGASRKYAVVDYSPTVGCHVVLITGLDGNYAEKKEIVVTAGGTPSYVATILQFLRINSFRVIATGSGGKPTGALALMDNAASPTITYSYITAGFTRARNTMYTVPAGKTLYVYQWHSSFSANASNKTEYCRLYTRVTQYISDSGYMFSTHQNGGVPIWYPYSEVSCGNAVSNFDIASPTKILEKCSVKVSGVASGAGVATSVLRGWLE
jgi:hypothetical protein